jgi:hypothetical protein
LPGNKRTTASWPEANVKISNPKSQSRWLHKNMDNLSVDANLRAVGEVNMLRNAVVLDLIARVVSFSPAYLTDRWCFVH